MTVTSETSVVTQLENSLSRSPVEAKPRLTAVSPGPDLTVVVPTLNERENIAPLLDRFDAALEGVAWEAIFVDDDSRDGTADHIRDIARRDSRVRCLQRVGRRGLTTACVEGILASAAPYVAVIDADLQHDESILPRMLQSLQQEPYDIVVGSRYVTGGSLGDWDRNRVRISGFATWLSRVICRAEIADPMSGFFMLPRHVFEASARGMSGQGFKILLDLLASSPQPLRIKELPYKFGKRRFGESKLDTLVVWEFIMLIADKLIGHVVPVRFALFALIGGLGLLVHLAVLWLSFNIVGISFVLSQTIATTVAMTSNFFLNNLFTYRDLRIKGWRLVRGLFSFYLICALGAVANVGIAFYVFAADQKWWVAGIAGVIVGAVWNYAVSSVFTWKK